MPDTSADIAWQAANRQIFLIKRLTIAMIIDMTNDMINGLTTMTMIVHRTELIRQSTVHLRPDQQSAANMLCMSLVQGGHQAFAAAPGAGKSVVLGAALNLYPGKVAVISRLAVLCDQTIHIFANLGVGDHVAFYLARGRKLPDLSRFDLIVATECMRDRSIDHPNILRII